MSVRVQAFLLHFAGSVVIAFLVLLLVFGLWYPAPLHEAVGVAHVFLLLLLVDVLLGPLMTFVVFKVGKKSLFFDLIIIACLQFAALAYGLSTLAEGRPIWLVFSVDRFDLIRGPDIDVRQLGHAAQEYRNNPWFGPKWAAAAMPDDVAKRNEVLFESVGGGADISQRPDLYRPLAVAADILRSKAHNLDELREYNAFESVQRTLLLWPAADAWLPLKANAKSMVVLIKKQTAEVVAIVDLAPWN